jgi:hypothetical protein
MDQVDPDRLVFLDESGLDTRLIRTYSYCVIQSQAPYMW